MALLLQRTEGLRHGSHFLACGWCFCYILHGLLLGFDNKYAYVVSFGGIDGPRVRG
jgi:hypothetical protein